MTTSRSYDRRVGVPAGSLGRVVAVSLAVVLGPTVHALGQATVEGISGAGDQGKRLSVFIGAFVGVDDNVARAQPGEEKSDTVIEVLGDLAFVFRKNLNRVELRYHVRSDRYSEQSDQDFDESRTLLNVHAALERTRFALRAEHALLAEPRDIEISDNRERTRIAFLPEVDLTFAGMELGLGCSVRSIRHDDAAFEYLDRDDSTLRTELRWRRAEAESQQVYAHLDLGRTSYGEGKRTDFDHSRLYVGWRSEAPGKSGIEIGAGTDTFHSSSISSETNVFGLVRYRANVPGRGDRSALEVAYSRGAEAAATADYKTESTFLVRYIHATSPRLAWSISLLSESAEFINPDEISPGQYEADSLFRFFLDAALQLEFGRPRSARGRCYVSLGYEMREGDLDEHDYRRMRALAGLAFVY